MLRLIYEAFQVLVAAIYSIIRGESETYTVDTGKCFSYTFRTDHLPLRFTSQEFRHVTKFKRWYMSSRVRYSYLVQVSETNESGEVRMLRCIPMPLLCSRYFTDSSLPHRLAITECVKLFIPQ